MRQNALAYGSVTGLNHSLGLCIDCGLNKATVERQSCKQHHSRRPTDETCIFFMPSLLWSIKVALYALQYPQC